MKDQHCRREQHGQRLSGMRVGGLLGDSVHRVHEEQLGETELEGKMETSAKGLVCQATAAQDF